MSVTVNPQSRFIQISGNDINVGILLSTTTLIGRYLIVDSNHVLREMTTGEKLRCKVNPAFKNKTKKKVGEVIKKLSETHIGRIKYLLPRLRELSTSVFDRSWLGLSNLDALSNEKYNRDYNVLSIAQKVNFCSFTLGIRPSKGKGFSDSYIIEGVYGKKLGIFKPALGEPMSLSHPNPLILFRNVVYLAINKVFNVLGTIPTMVMGQGFIAEMVTKDTADAMGQDSLVSSTHIILMQLGKQTVRGSFQEFDKGETKDLSEFLGTGKNFPWQANHNNFERIPSEEWLHLGMLHYITGNVDGHGENILVYQDKEDIEDDQYHLLAIDGGMSFGEDLFVTSNETQKFLMWLHYLPVQDLKFSAQHLQMLDTIIESIEEDGIYYEKEKSFQKRLQALKVRTEVLRKCIRTNQPMGKLLELKTKSQMEAFLSEPLPEKKVEKRAIAKTTQTLSDLVKTNASMEELRAAWRVNFRSQVRQLRINYTRMVFGSGISYEARQEQLQSLKYQKKVTADLFSRYTVQELRQNLENGLAKTELLISMYSS